jgi:hypothetical protein
MFFFFFFFVLPLATFTAFERSANPEVFDTTVRFMIVDVGFQETTVIVGVSQGN